MLQDAYFGTDETMDTSYENLTYMDPGSGVGPKSAMNSHQYSAKPSQRGALKPQSSFN